MNRLKLIASLVCVLFSLSMMGGNNRDFDVVVSGTKTEPRILGCKAPEFSFHLPQMAGNFRIGLSNGKESRWTGDLKKVTFKNEKGRLVYTMKDPLLGNGTLVVKVVKLSDSDGIVLEVEAENLPEGIELIWSFGGCYGKVLDNRTDSRMKPEFCKYNVFSVEGTAFSVYYGESMRLKIIQGVTPLESDIRLSDAHQQQSPLAFYGSGKKTDAPALAAACPLTGEKKLYFCFYTQNQRADYNYYMLPALFDKEFTK